VSNVYYDFFETTFFYGKTVNQKHVVMSISRNFLTKLKYYSNYYVVIWR
jgi:hypothetical protein